MTEDRIIPAPPGPGVDPQARQLPATAPVMGEVSQAPPDLNARRTSRRPFKIIDMRKDPELAAYIVSGPDWDKSKWRDEDLAFGMTTATLPDEMAASKSQTPQLTLLENCVVYIGGRTNLDYTYKSDWLSAIGPKGRAAVADIWQRLHQVPDNTGKALWEAASDWTTGG